WAMLDELEQPEVKTDSTETTLEMVAIAAQSDVRSVSPRRQFRRYLTFTASLFAAGILGFLCVALARPDPDRRLLEDLAVVERLDEYRQSDNIELLRELRKSGLFLEDSSDD
ncbi:unnamed protein product, partial [marine sediment metagenome]